MCLLSPRPYPRNFAYIIINSHNSPARYRFFFHFLQLVQLCFSSGKHLPEAKQMEELEFTPQISITSVWEFLLYSSLINYVQICFFFFKIHYQLKVFKGNIWWQTSHRLPQVREIFGDLIAINNAQIFNFKTSLFNHVHWDKSDFNLILNICLRLLLKNKG